MEKFLWSPFTILRNSAGGNCKNGGVEKLSFLLHIPGDYNKHDPERENWPCRVVLPILPIQSISGSRLLP